MNGDHWPIRGKRWSHNVIGAGWMLLGAVAFTAMTALVKYLGADYPATLQTFYRQLAGLAVLLPLILRHRRTAFSIGRLGLMTFRVLATVSGLMLTYESFRTMPLADANALSFTRILWVVPLAALFLQEPIGFARIAATLVGFSGVLVMLRPGGMGVGWPHLAALVGALLLACANVSAKSLANDYTMLPLLVWSAVIGVAVALPPALLTWRWPGAGDFALLSLMGVFGVVVQICFLNGLRTGDTAAVVPVDYTRLVFAAVVGFTLFGEVPDAITMTGAGIVVTATLFIVWYEQRAVKPALQVRLGQSGNSPRANSGSDESFPLPR